MVDKERRKKLALHLRHLSVGLISNDEFETAVMDDVSYGWLPEQYYRSREAKSDDPVIQPMLYLCWGLYDDTRNHKLTKGDKLSKNALKIIARCILFLHSGREYEWPELNKVEPFLRFSLKDIMLTILTLGYYYRKKRYEKWQKLGPYDVWPFFREMDYKNQLKKHPFLGGQTANT